MNRSAASSTHDAKLVHFHRQNCQDTNHYSQIHANSTLQGSLAGRFEALLNIIYSIVLYERPFSISSPGQNNLYIFVCKAFDPGIQHLISRSEISRL